jgi:hypothetical protein
LIVIEVVYNKIAEIASKLYILRSRVF